MNTPHWQQLNARCVEALDRFNREAMKTCRLLSEMEVFPISVETRSTLAHQRFSENDAYNCYLEARQELCNLATLGATSATDPEPDGKWYPETDVDPHLHALHDHARLLDNLVIHPLLRR
jgi:hypothetical protein